MIDKRFSDKPIHFELSMGNAGNTLDGQIISAAAKGDGEGESTTTTTDDVDGSVESLSGTWNSMTPATKPLSHDRLYYFLPFWDEKPTVYIRNSFPDHRRRMYQSNVIHKLADKLVRLFCASM